MIHQWSFSERTFRSIFENINKLRKSRTLCDVVLKVEDELFYSHRVILSASSDYFCAMFTNEMKEKELQVIPIQGISARTMAILLDCVYSEAVDFTIENVQEILPAAALLQLNEIKAGCEDFLKNSLDPHNALGIRQFAELHSCTNLNNACQEYIFEHFSQIVQNSDEFSSMMPKELEELIKSDEIEVANEELVYNCVFNWINFDRKSREEYLPQLMVHLRLPLLSPQFLTDVCDKEVMIKQSFECRDILDEVLDYFFTHFNQ